MRQIFFVHILIPHQAVVLPIKIFVSLLFCAIEKIWSAFQSLVFTFDIALSIITDIRQKEVTEAHLPNSLCQGFMGEVWKKHFSHDFKSIFY